MLARFYRRVAQLVRALARHARGRRFESDRAYQVAGVSQNCTYFDGPLNTWPVVGVTTD